MLDITEGAFNSMVIQRILTRDSKAGTALYSIANSTRSTHRYLYFFFNGTCPGYSFVPTLKLCPGLTYFEKFFWVLNFNASFDILDNIIVDHAVLFSLYKDKFLKYGLHERRE